MVNAKFDVIVIGGGPSAWVALQAIPLNLSILNIDVGKVEKPETSNLIEKAGNLIQQPMNLDGINNLIQEIVQMDAGKIGSKKSSFGDYFLYGTQNSNHLRTSDLTKSVAAGGFTNVWGATMLPYPNAILEQFDSSTEEKLRNGYNFISENIPISKFNYHNSMYISPKKTFSLNNATKLQTKLLKPQKLYSRICLKLFDASFEPISLAVQLQARSSKLGQKVECAYCGMCQIGCPSRLIWNPRFFSIDRSFESLTKYKGEVLRIIKKADEYQIECLNESIRFTGTHVILAAGALGTAEILSKSVLANDFSHLKINDNQTIFRHAISFQKVGTLKPRVNLAELSFIINAGGKNPLHAQLYSISMYSKARIFLEFPIIRRFQSRIIDLLLKRLVTLLVYLPQHQSGNLQTNNAENEFRVFEHPKKIKSLQKTMNFFKLAVPLLTQGIILIPFFKHKLGVGGGNHIGATEYFDSQNKFTPICNIHGVLQGENQILIADTSALPILYPGPITMSSMALGYSNTEHYFKFKNN